MAKIASTELGRKDAPCVVFAHGWARSHADFIAIAELIAPHAHCLLLDLPGFGDSPRPDGDWGTQEYADCLRAHLSEMGISDYIWVGHSFGARVGLRLAAMPDSPVKALVLAAGAGVKRPVPKWNQIKGSWRSRVFKRKKAQAVDEAALIALEREYGSPDYVQSRDLGLRDIFVKTVQEDQSDAVGAITCPTTLIYGGKDTETPPEVGKILHRLIPNSAYIECPEFDHLSILTRGRHQIATVLKEQLVGGHA